MPVAMIMLRCKFKLLTLCALLAPLAASATTSKPVAPIGAPDVLSVSGGLLLVVVAIVVLGFLYARMQGQRGSSGGVINIIATQPIGPKERIAIVEVADKQLLIGMTSSSVQTLHVFDKPVVIKPVVTGNFAHRLKNAMRGAQQ